MATIQQSIDISAPVSACYDQWMNFQDFPRFMRHVQSVTQVEDNRWHWVVDGPLGVPIEWDAIMDGNEQDHAISWHSLPESRLNNRGEVRFEALEHSRITSTLTRVTVTIDYEPPAGAFGEAAAKVLFSDPEQMVKDSLQNFKQLMENTLSADFAEESII